MNEIDELFTGYLADIGNPAPGAAADLARRIVDDHATAPTRRPWRPRVHHLRRTVALAASLVGVTALLTVLGVLIVQAPTSAVPATGDPRPPRVEWGLTAVVGFDPSPGSDVDATAARLTEALTERARVRDIAGLRIERTGAHELQLTVPGAADTSEVTDLARFPAVDVYDLSTSLIASGSWLGDLLSATRELRGPAARYLVQSARLGAVAIAGTREEAEKLLGSAAAATGVILPIPDGVVLVDRHTGRLPEVALVRATPLVTAEQLRHASFVGHRLELVAADPGAMRPVIERAVTRRPAPTLMVVSRQSDDRASEIAASSVVTTTPTGLALSGLRTDSDEHVLFGSGEPLAAVTVTDVATTPYGAVPAPLGDRNAPRPAMFDDPTLAFFSPGTSPSDPGTSTPVAAGSIVTVLEAARGQQRWTVYAGMTTSGREASWILGGTADPDFGTGICGSGAGVPVLRGCGSRGIGTEFVVFGRARREVASIEGRTTDGQTLPGVVGNGWFLVPYRTEDIVHSESPDVIARDSHGNVIATLVAGGRLVMNAGP